ncbi:MAG: hypothetical protein GY870_16920 [archaeon]|nr:hypothetical protein [archaeon]
MSEIIEKIEMTKNTLVDLKTKYEIQKKDLEKKVVNDIDRYSWKLGFVEGQINIIDTILETSHLF